ncbi:MAG: hypothetical protein KJ774_00300 [Firmicutes bacterium]|nr:hypothetical protein [Bacillota bacterium]
MFEELLKILDEFKDGYSVPIEISADNDGYLDRECPKEDCLSKFKINEHDWCELPINFPTRLNNK